MSHPIRVSMSALTPEQVERLATVVCVWWESDLEVTAPELPTHLLPSDTTPCDSCRLEAQGLAPVVAALIAEAVDQARAEERERIAAAIEQMVTDCTDPDVPREKWGRHVNGWATGMERAATIARSQP